ncbi:MAG: PDZ domain-containing protein [Planctomycetota bacterium]|nr:MAG: PDZ domain-containing protein [Planctomycetota bacterium]REJ98611.1 MAG: PDZ domain-containing protein [Planctomycetota bacterium]REK29911.1 MAG: PDZ domain-containing protein [Planctomycetota bacterium]REK47919.1 MAG: PDZ domain-containing protein [Planctomycetota bacterium]
MEAEASELRRTAVVRAVEKNRDAIVNIRGQKMIQSASSGFEQDAPRRVNGMGTGVVIDPRGYIITNHHVVDGVANVQVTLANGEKYRARLLAHDPRTDLALIKIAPREKKLPVIRLGTSSDLMPGEPVIAVGNAYGYENTVTRGIISALHRRVQVSDQQEYDNLIQTDASINPGNSGGPLLNIDGEMIGLNAAVRVGAQGIGFALPIDDVLAVSSRLMSIKRMDRNWHGVVASHVAHPGRDGILVKTVEAESPAAKVGIQAGDVITRVDSVTVRNPIDIERALLGRAAGDAVSITYRRKDQPQESRFVLESYEPRPRSQGDDPWQLLGLRFEELRPSEVRSISDRYRGGLRITEVRESSPAHQQGFRRGDILVGMHIWETVSSENVQYVLRHKDLAEFAPVKFYILRGDQTLYGHLRMAAADAR